MTELFKSLLDDIRTQAGASLEDARTLPFAIYHDRSIYELEREKLFNTEWIFVCTKPELPQSGDYLALKIADEPLVIIHGEDGEFRAFSNVCRHRGTILLDPGFGHAPRRFSCPYHGWTYNDRGQLIGVPFPGDSVVEKEAHCLPQFQVSVWQGLIFVNLNAHAETLDSRYAGMTRYLKSYESHRFETAYPGGMELWNCNWKIALENAMESYHLFEVHKDTLEKYTPTKEAFYVEGQPGWAVTGGKIQGGSNKGNDDYYLLFCVSPSLVCVLTYESFDWLSILPSGPDRCWVRSGSLSVAGGNAANGSQSFFEKFLAEDRTICERNQQGMSARHTLGGKLVEIERVIVDFHQYWGWRVLAGKGPVPHRSSNADYFL